VFDSLKRAFSSDDPSRDFAGELARLDESLDARRDELEAKRQARLQALFPQGPVEGWGPQRFPELDPLNFEDDQGESWLITVATRIIDNFPGSETLLSQLDTTLRAFSDANHLRVEPEGPYAQLLTWRDEILHSWDLQLTDPDVPIYVASGAGGCKVVGCSRPFVILDTATLDALDEPTQRFLLATTLGHLFFGNLKIFSFHRLMETLDKLPSMGGLITRGLGMIPVVGNTISRGIEIARSVNNQVIRKTNLVVGMRQHLLCDRLAVLSLGDPEPARRYFSHTVLPSVESAVLHPRLVAQGRLIRESFERGEVDLQMMSVVGPTAGFSAWRAYKLEAWVSDEAYAQLGKGLYVTRSRLEEYRRTHRKLEDEIKALESKLLDLHERREKVQAELTARVAQGAAGQEPA
jgi:hypothetical protein